MDKTIGTDQSSKRRERYEGLRSLLIEKHEVPACKLRELPASPARKFYKGDIINFYLRFKDTKPSALVQSGLRLSTTVVTLKRIRAQPLRGSPRTKRHTDTTIENVACVCRCVRHIFPHSFRFRLNFPRRFRDRGPPIDRLHKRDDDIKHRRLNESAGARSGWLHVTQVENPIRPRPGSRYPGP
ncbi:hypothetical protein EVAR_90215_1 [Eumeta japonica]|uniref:Uncharacterized protein n=1 Tax=Eumeta variegata TaxID=151549 RepID=A0A4C1WWA5_EUMVA|nr:hypothetical protein EVAR_90215_1 [Eumeta japonica]